MLQKNDFLSVQIRRRSDKLKQVTIIIPTYNEEKNIANCLNSIFQLEYPKQMLQVLVIDGNSTDKTKEIASKLGAEVINTTFPNEEMKKPFAINIATGEIIGLIDADNVIPAEKNWLQRMIQPFEDKEISAVDTLFYTFRKEDNLITKYCALIGGDDPIATYLGINDRTCFFSGLWTKKPHSSEYHDGYLKVKLTKNEIPAIGSNGYFFRKELFNASKNTPFIHPIFVNNLVNDGYDKMAKVNQGVIHVQSDKITRFFRKKMRRINRRKSSEIKWDYNYNLKTKSFIFTGLYIAAFIPLVIDALRGYIKKPTLAWILHPFVSFALLFVYAFNFLSMNLPFQSHGRTQ